MTFCRRMPWTPRSGRVSWHETACIDATSFKYRLRVFNNVPGDSVVGMFSVCASPAGEKVIKLCALAPWRAMFLLPQQPERSGKLPTHRQPVPLDAPRPVIDCSKFANFRAFSRSMRPQCRSTAVQLPHNVRFSPDSLSSVPLFSYIYKLRSYKILIFELGWA